jgi:hypothetical protein
MAKKVIEIKDLVKERKQIQLKHYQPFLKGKFRTVLSSELRSETILKELFGSNETEFYKLDALYVYQNL